MPFATSNPVTVRYEYLATLADIDAVIAIALDNYFDVTLNTHRTEGVNEVHMVTVSGGPTAGTWTYGNGVQTTVPIAFDADAATVQTAIEGLPAVEVGDVAVSSGASGIWAITFMGNLAKQNLPTPVVEHTFTGGAEPGITAQTIVGGRPDSDTYSATLSKSNAGSVTTTLGHYLVLDGGKLHDYTSAEFLAKYTPQ